MNKKVKQTMYFMSKPFLISKIHQIKACILSRGDHYLFDSQYQVLLYCA
ncbi:hypothetical protein NB713_000110 [Xanthomonas sacchari]|nr:hypothetical protein [Xanthomonas sacchari]MCW0457844.1 hypothetical protein [Xanthomonas sacchari]